MSQPSPATLEKITPLCKRRGFVYQTAENYGGSMVVEFAPTTLKQKLDQWGSPQADFVLMRRIKDSLDPLNVLNPGRFLGGI